jgi:hypothetical protein
MNGSVAPPLAGGAVTERTQECLAQTKPWVRLVSVLTFIGAGFMALGGLAMFVVGATAGASSNNALGGMVGGAVLGLVYLAMAGLYVAPGIFLSRYASAINRLRQDGSTATLEDALMHQRSFWRYVGILSLVGMILGALVMVIAIAAGIYAATSR